MAGDRYVGMAQQALALLEIRVGWLVRVIEYPRKGPNVVGLRGAPPEPRVVLGVVSQVEQHGFRVGSLAELGDGKSYRFTRHAMPHLRVEVLDRSHELEVEVVDDRRTPKTRRVCA